LKQKRKSQKEKKTNRYFICHAFSNITNNPNSLHAQHSAVSATGPQAPSDDAQQQQRQKAMNCGKSPLSNRHRNSIEQPSEREPQQQSGQQ
jgi:hypothetical protein